MKIIFDLCRICIQESGDISVKDKPNEYLCNLSANELIVSLSNISPEFDTNESTICSNCFIKLQNVIELVELIDNSTQKLNEIFKTNLSESEDVIECIADKIEGKDVTQEKNDTLYKKVCVKGDSDTDENIQKESSGSDANEIVVKKGKRRKYSRRKTKTKKEDESVESRTCKECGKVFSRIHNLKRHSTVHSGEKPYQCDKCPKSFSQEGNLTTHKKVHTGERPYVCEICSKQFAKSMCLKQHMVTHLPDSAKKFICDDCGKAFYDKTQLNRHKLCHGGIKAFECLECNKHFYTKFALSQHHQTVHLAIKKHICSVCTKAFSNSGNLTAHLRIHTGEKPYECKYCDARFNQSTPHVRHMQAHIENGDPLKSHSE